MNNDIKKYELIVPRIDHVCHICSKKIERKKTCAIYKGQISWRYYGREYVHLDHLKMTQIQKRFRNKLLMLISINDIKTFFNYDLH